MPYIDRLSEHCCKILVYYVFVLKLLGTAVVEDPPRRTVASASRWLARKPFPQAKDRFIVIDRFIRRNKHAFTMALHFYPGQLRQEYDMN